MAIPDNSTVCNYCASSQYNRVSQQQLSFLLFTGSGVGVILFNWNWISKQYLNWKYHWGWWPCMV